MIVAPSRCSGRAPCHTTFHRSANRRKISDVISIRRAGDGDLPFLDAMVSAVVNWDPTRMSLSPEAIADEPELQRYLVGWPRATDIGLVAENDGVPIGAAWLRYFDAAEPGYGFLDESIPELSIGVVQEWRGRGVGSRLLEALIDLARERGDEAISLSVEARNPALGLYERHGFRPIAVVGEALTMRRDLVREGAGER